MPEVGHYEVLGVQPNADDAEIKSAFRKLARKLHPDMGGDPDRFAEVHASYEVLSDPKKRHAYDQSRIFTSFEEDLGGDFGAPFADRTRPNFTKPASTPDEPPAPFTSSVLSEVPFDPARLTWWTQVDPETPVAITPGFAPPRGANMRWNLLSLGAGVVGAGAGWLLGYPLAAIAVLGATAAMLTFPTPLGRKGISTPMGELPLSGILGLVSLVLFAFTIWKQSLPMTVVAGLAVALGVSFAGFIGLTRLARRREELYSLDQMIDQRIAEAQFLNANEDESIAFNDSVASARTLTKNLLTPLVQQIPGARLITGIPFPGMRLRSVDHVLVVGRRVALIENKISLPGRYAFNGLSSMLYNGSPFIGGELNTATALNGWRALLNDTEANDGGYDVRAFVIVHPLPAGPVRIVAPETTLFDVVPSDRARELIGSWLADGDPVVDRHLLASLLTARPVVHEKWENVR